MDVVKEKRNQFHTIISGGVSAAITRLFSQPLDVIKVRIQLQNEGTNLKEFQPKYRNAFQAMRVIYAEEGFLALWKGHNPAQVISIANGISQFWMYEQLRDVTRNMTYFRDHKNVSTFLCGTIAGCTATAITMPVDVIKTRLISQDPQKGYSSASKAIFTIIEEEGVRGCYRGLLSSILQIGPMMGCNFMFYRFFSRTAEGIFKVEHSGQLPSWILLIMGCLAGLLSKSLVYPFDLVQRRLQIEGFENRTVHSSNISCRGIIQCLKTTVEIEGFRGLYKGMTLSLMKIGWMAGLHFGLYDKIFTILQGNI